MSPRSVWLLIPLVAACEDTIVGQANPAQIQVVDQLDFQDVTVGQSVTRALPINNVGGLPLRIESVSAAAPFSVVTQLVAVPAFDDATIDVRFAPTSVGEARVELVIRSDAVNGADKRVVLIGTGVADDNRAPSATVAIRPAAPRTSDTLTATVTATDPDGDSVQLRYRWTKDGVEAGSAATIASADTARGQRWKLAVTPTDGRADGTAATAEVTIANTPPTLAAVSISPTMATANDPLTAMTSGEQDDDGDPIAVTLRWFVAGTETHTGATLAAGAARNGQQVFVRATPNDGIEDGPSIDSAPIVIGNSPPSIAAAVIGPADPRETDPISATITGWQDPDGDAEGYRYRWQVGGVDVGTAATIDGASFDKGDMIQLFVTPHDGLQPGLQVTSNVLTAVNTPPGAPTVDIQPANATAADDLTCVVTATSSDADGDTVTYHFEWTRNGNPAATGATVGSAMTAAQERWTCTVTPNDGDEDGAQAQASLTVRSDSQSRWDPMNTQNAPSARDLHGAVWTGTEMVVWGGRQSDARETGGRYQPALDRWRSVSTTGAPRFHTSGGSGGQLIWTGDLVVAWQGYDGGSQYGGRYDPSQDSWQPIATANQPSTRRLYPVVWTGTEVIIWGGCDQLSTAYGTGARYDPVADRWTTMSTTNAPTARCQHASVWTGTELIVWGGMGTGGADRNDGARYDPVLDTWAPITSSGAPTAQRRPAYVWTGTELIVFGGSPAGSSGGRFDPSANTWRPVSTAGAPTGQHRAAIWTGSEMFVFGGQNSGASDACGLYDPSTDRWRNCPTLNKPSARYLHSVVWTGTEAIVWGGAAASASHHADGAKFTP